MEIVMQWLDELDDLVTMIAAKSESLRRIRRMLGVSLAALLALAAGAAATAMQPVVAPVIACLLATAYWYRRPQHAAADDLQAAGH